MSNNYFEFTIPYFNDTYGSDWDNFRTIMESMVDHLMSKTYQLYWLNDPNYYSVKVAEAISQSLDITYSSATPLATKKYNIRNFINNYANKGLEDTYLGIQESIVGVRGAIYGGTMHGWRLLSAPVNDGNRWGSGAGTSSDNLKWNTSPPQFYIYIDVKTTNAALLDLIEEEYEKPEMLPAFFTIFLVDSSFNYLRTIG